MNLRTVTLLAICFSSLPSQRAIGRTTSDEITTKIGSEFSVEVFENGTTGYLWFALSQGPEDPIKLLRKESVPEEKPSEMIAGKGHNVRFIFRAKQQGSYLINLVYKRLWEDGIAEYKTVRVNVTA